MRGHQLLTGGLIARDICQHAPLCRHLVSSKPPGNLLPENGDRGSQCARPSLDVTWPAKCHSRQKLRFILFPKDLTNFLNVTPAVGQREKGFDLDSV